MKPSGHYTAPVYEPRPTFVSEDSGPNRPAGPLIYCRLVNRKKAEVGRGIAHLRRIDPIMNQLIPKCAPLTDLRLERNRFLSLANSILSQQISVHAARAIKI